MDLITPDLGLIFWQTVTLLFVLLILSKFAWKPILKAIHEREKKIEAALQTIEISQKMEAQVQANTKAMLKTARAEHKKLIGEAISARNKIIEEAKVEACEMGKKVTEQTRLLLKEEKEKAKRELQNEVATLSVQIAEKLLHNELRQQPAQEKLTQELIKKTSWG